MKIIKSATFRLTLSYLAVIMVLSIGFSSLLYQVSSSELTRGYRRPLSTSTFFQVPDSIQQLREQELAEGQGHLLQNLIMLNLFTLLSGGVLSYLLARWTLHPIEEAMEAQGRFTADASHELRTPLTAMQSEIEVSLRNPKLTNLEAKQLLRSNLEEIAKLRALSDGLLKLTQADGQELPRSRVDLSLTTAEAVERLRHAATLKQIKLDSNLKSVSTLGDSVSLIELAAILIDNAIKYSPTKSTVTITTFKVGNQAVLAVQDRGQGIKASDQPHIFDRFYRADRSRSKEVINGYGLGLSIAQQIAEQHDAVITVRSQLGRGTTFTVKFPAV